MMIDTIMHGDALTMMSALPSESVHCIVTSPPYFGLRDYGADGQIGQERTVETYVAALVDVFREARRVLRSDGTLWLNLGDSYASGGGGDPQHLRQWAEKVGDPRKGGKKVSAGHDVKRAPRPTGLKPKDLMMIPARVALALQADGWWLRAEIVWAKPNPMPESVTDRPTRSHEMLYLLAKSPNYYYHADAIREPLARPEEVTRANPSRFGGAQKYAATSTRLASGNPYNRAPTGGRNKRDVWRVSLRPYHGAHFATFPPRLIEPCVLAGCPQRVCEHCGAPWVRETEKATRFEGGSGKAGRSAEDVNAHGKWAGKQYGKNLKLGPVISVTTTGYRPTCRCEHNTGSGRGVVLDPFFGSGTVGMVARRHSRHYLGIELNADYIALAENRIASELQPVLWSAGAEVGA